MIAIIDRFEGDCAVVEMHGKIQTIKRTDIPVNASEGDMLLQRSGKWIIAKEQTEKRAKRIAELAKDLWHE